MARIRSIKPEIRISEKVNSWPVEVRYFWIMLWGYCDDYGRGRDNAKLIVADTYPLDDDVTNKDVTKWMAILEKSGVIQRYEVDDGKYFAIVNWKEHQRPSHPARSVIPEAPAISGSPPEQFARITESGSPEQGAESREQRAVEQPASVAPTTPAVLESFETAWKEYPIKKEKKTAINAYKKALKDVTAERILEAVKSYKNDPTRDPKFTKHFTT